MAALISLSLIFFIIFYESVCIWPPTLARMWYKAILWWGSRTIWDSCETSAKNTWPRQQSTQPCKACKVRGDGSLRPSFQITIITIRHEYRVVGPEGQFHLSEIYVSSRCIDVSSQSSMLANFLPHNFRDTYSLSVIFRMWSLAHSHQFPLVHLSEFLSCTF